MGNVRILIASALRCMGSLFLRAALSLDDPYARHAQEMAEDIAFRRALEKEARESQYTTLRIVH